MDNKFIVIPSIALLASVALWGWGWLARRCARVSELPVVVTMGVGMAVVILIGGILNVARIAFPVAFDGIILTGVLLAVAGGWQGRTRIVRRPSVAMAVATIPLIAAAWFLIAQLVPQAAYNIHDDLEKYFAHPVEMLALGTLPPNFLGSLGMETLGGQTVLHAFAAAHFPLVYLGTVDAVYCLLFCVALAGFAVAPGRWGLGAMAAGMCVLAINPQLVNISSLYSGTALMMTALCVVAMPGATRRDDPPAPLLLGLVYAGLLALKTSFVPFVAVHFVAVLGLGPLPGRSRWAWGAKVAGWAGLFLVPWLLLHAPLYLAPARPPPAAIVAGDPIQIHLFSTRTLGYGATQLHYTLLAFTALGCASAAAVARWRGWVRCSWPVVSLAAAGLSAAVFYFAIGVYFAPLLFSDPGGTRYSCPILLAVVPISLRLLRMVEGPGARRVRPVVAAGLGFALVSLFWQSAWNRAQQWTHYHVPLAFFPKGDEVIRREYIEYTRAVLDGPTRLRVENMQELVRPGAPLGVWISTPFLLDYRRNRITRIDLAGLTMRWARMPADVRYLLFQHHGYAVRTPDDYAKMARSPGSSHRRASAIALDFLADLYHRAASAEIIYEDEEYVLLRWNEPWPEPASFRN